MAFRSRSESTSRGPGPKAKHSSRRAPAAGDSSATVAGVRISHPDRVIYPDLEMSKIQFARYFERIADWIVPHVAGRPLTLVHCPAGIAAPCNFLKHAKAWGPSALRRVRIQEKTKVGEYLVADSIEAVVSLAQMGIVEIHTWNSTADDIERPNRIVWDLDPGPEVSWQQVVKGSRDGPRGSHDAEAQILGEDDRRSRAARGCSAQAQTHRRRMPQLLPCRQRSDRAGGSSDLYDRVR